MPKRKYGSRKYSKARKFRKKMVYRAKRKSGKVRRYLPLSDFPRQRTIRFKWFRRIVLDPGVSGTITTFQIRLNSIYDPEYNIGGDTVTNYSTYANLYGKYIVLGSKFTCNFLQSGATSTNPCVVGMAAARSPDQYVASTVDTMLRGNSNGEPTGRYKVCGGINGFNHKMTYKYSARKFWSIAKKDSVLTQDNQWSYFGQNPSAQPILTVWAGLVNGNIDPTGIDVFITGEFITQLRDVNHSAGL